MKRHPAIEVLQSKRLHHGRVFDVLAESIRLPSGLQQELDLVVHGGAVCIAALDTNGELVLVRQYRHAAGDWLLEIPAGRLEHGEDPLVAARRELEEETGLAAGRWELLRSFFAAPGFCSEELSLFLARDLESRGGRRAGVRRGRGARGRAAHPRAAAGRSARREDTAGGRAAHGTRATSVRNAKPPCPGRAAPQPS